MNAYSLSSLFSFRIIVLFFGYSSAVIITTSAFQSSFSQRSYHPLNKGELPSIRPSLHSTYNNVKIPSSTLFLGNENNSNINNNKKGEGITVSGDEYNWTSNIMTQNPKRSILFSLIMSACGAVLGPFLDSYHSAFGVLSYDEPITAVLWGSIEQPALITAWWVPELFGLAGFIIGWLYIILDTAIAIDNISEEERIRIHNPSPSSICLGISGFTFQYWLSGALYSNGVDRSLILLLMSTLSGIGFLTLDKTFAGFITSSATAIGGPVIEIVLLSVLVGHGGYHYSDLGETGFFPLWIIPVYFLGGPAVGNLARGVWNTLLSTKASNIQTNNNPNDIATTTANRTPCNDCNDSRCVSCPNCDGVGNYITYGTIVKCNCCKGRGLVICRTCFSNYDEDPADIETIRDIMRRMPD